MTAGLSSGRAARALGSLGSRQVQSSKHMCHADDQLQHTFQVDTGEQLQGCSATQGNKSVLTAGKHFPDRGHCGRKIHLNVAGFVGCINRGKRAEVVSGGGVWGTMTWTNLGQRCLPLRKVASGVW